MQNLRFAAVLFLPVRMLRSAATGIRIYSLILFPQLQVYIQLDFSLVFSLFDNNLVQNRGWKSAVDLPFKAQFPIQAPEKLCFIQRPGGKLFFLCPTGFRLGFVVSVLVIEGIVALLKLRRSQFLENVTEDLIQFKTPYLGCRVRRPSLLPVDFALSHSVSGDTICRTLTLVLEKAIYMSHCAAYNRSHFSAAIRNGFYFHSGTDAP